MNQRRRNVQQSWQGAGPPFPPARFPPPYPPGKRALHSAASLAGVILL